MYASLGSEMEVQEENRIHARMRLENNPDQLETLVQMLIPSIVDCICEESLQQCHCSDWYTCSPGGLAMTKQHVVYAMPPVLDYHQCQPRPLYEPTMFGLCSKFSNSAVE
jgi:hypothetical protein